MIKTISAKFPQANKDDSNLDHNSAYALAIARLPSSKPGQVIRRP